MSRPAADAAHPVRAGAAAGFHVGRLGADAERDRDLADAAALVLAVEQCADLSSQMHAGAVVLVGGELLDGCAGASFGD